ncbi:MAG: alpha/beta hydrolase [Verrucomicrobiota bacterium]
MKSTGKASIRTLVVRVFATLAVVTSIPLVFITSCQSKLIYFPRPYGAEVTAKWSAETHGKPIEFTTSQGRQKAFLQGKLKSPRNLWIVCGGNGTVALDWSEWLRKHAPPEDAYLLVDFPGYGDCEGYPNPARIRESLRAAVPLATKTLGWSDPNPEQLRFFGHSLGAGACLIGATEFKIQRGILLAPFTSTMDMADVVIGLPVGFLVTHRFDNEARLAELAARGPGEVIIIHGSDDESIPVTMGRKLAEQRKDVVHFIEIPGARHNTIQDQNAGNLSDALRKIGH